MKQLAIIIRAEELKDDDDDRPSNVYGALISQSKQDESTRRVHVNRHRCGRMNRDYSDYYRLLHNLATLLSVLVPRKMQLVFWR